MSYQPIENYGVVGNMRTVALVSMHGSVDWFCFPHFDSPSVFAAILDDKKGGRFVVRSTHKHVRFKQFYWPDTNVLVTRFLCPDGVGELQDFMPVAAAMPTNVPTGSSAALKFPAGKWSFPCAASRRSTMRAPLTSVNRARAASSSAPTASPWSW